MSFVDRFKNRQVLTPILDVPFRDFVFKIARFSEMERKDVRLKARARIRDGGDNPDKATDAEQTVAYCIMLPDFLRRHVKGWTCPEHLGIPFNAGNLVMLFDEMDERERIELSLAYLKATDEDEQKKIPELRANGATSSLGGSGTNSKSQNSDAPSVVSS